MSSTNVSRRERMQLVTTMCRNAIFDSAHTLAQHGLDPEAFAGVVREALLTSPEIIDCTDQSLARAFRKSCRDGLIPDGVQAAITTRKKMIKQPDGSKVWAKEAVFWPMKDGLQKLAHEDMGAEIRSGHVREGDVVRVTDSTGMGKDPTIEIEFPTDYFERPQGKLVGVWCWIKIPGQTARLFRWRREQIDKAKAASKTTYEGRPWDVWEDRMAEKAIIKSSINSLRYLGLSERLKSALAEEDDFMAIEGPSAEVVALPARNEEQPVADEPTRPVPPKIELPPKKTEKPKTTRKRGQRAQVKKREEGAPQPMQKKEAPAEPVQMREEQDSRPSDVEPSDEGTFLPERSNQDEPPPHPGPEGSDDDGGEAEPQLDYDADTDL